MSRLKYFIAPDQDETTHEVERKRSKEDDSVEFRWDPNYEAKHSSRLRIMNVTEGRQWSGGLLMIMMMTTAIVMVVSHNL